MAGSDVDGSKTSLSWWSLPSLPSSCIFPTDSEDADAASTSPFPGDSAAARCRNDEFMLDMRGRNDRELPELCLRIFRGQRTFKILSEFCFLAWTCRGRRMSTVVS